MIHGDYSQWVNDAMLHSVTNYELHKGLYSGHNEHNYFEIAHTIRRLFDENYGLCRGKVLYSFVDNHDVNRIVSKLNDQRHLFSLYTLLFTLPGLPSIYYGSEWGVPGRKEDGGDPALRPRLILDEMEQNPPVPQLEEYIRFLGRCRRDYPVIGNGRYQELLLTNRQYAFARIGEGQMALVLVNNDDNPAMLSVPLPQPSQRITELYSGQGVQVQDSRLTEEIPAGGGRIFIANF